MQNFNKTKRYTLNAIRLKRGFTLVELILYGALLMILIYVLTDVFTSALDVQLESQGTSSVEQDGRFILSRLNNDILNAQTVIIPALPGSQSATLQLTTGNINYVYSLVSGNLQLVNNNGTDTLNSFDTTVSGLTFQRFGNNNRNDTIKIVFTLTSKATRTSGPNRQTFQETVAPR